MQSLRKVYPRTSYPNDIAEKTVRDYVVHGPGPLAVETIRVVLEGLDDFKF